jgi:hypothetical protein
LQPSIRAPDERPVDENLIVDPLIVSDTNERSVPTQYIPSRQHPMAGASFRHDPNIASSTIENLDDDDVYDPSKPTIFQTMSVEKVDDKTSTTVNNSGTTTTRVSTDAVPMNEGKSTAIT